MAGWTVELGEFKGGFRIYRNDDGAPCYYDDRLTYMKVSAYWQANAGYMLTEVGRTTISMDGIEVIGAQLIDDVEFSIVVEYQYHREDDIRRVEQIFVDDDIFHIGDTLTVSRTNTLPDAGLCELAGMERPCITWSGVIGSISISPILHEGLAEEDIFPLYNITPKPKQIRVRLIQEEEETD